MKKGKIKVKNDKSKSKIFREAGFRNFSLFSFLFSSGRARGRNRAGFTFMETLVAVAVLVLLAVVIVSGLAGFRETAGLDQAVDETIELLRDARSRTLGSENAASYGVHFEPTSVTMFTGWAWNASDPSNVVVALPSAVRISSIALSTTTASVVFERLTGEAAAAGTISFITLRSGKTAGVRIFSSGLFSKL